jgi:hypothetical protein
MTHAPEHTSIRLADERDPLMLRLQRFTSRLQQRAGRMLGSLAGGVAREDRRRGDRRDHPRFPRQDRRAVTRSRTPIPSPGDPSLHMTVLIHREGAHLSSGCLWDLGLTGAGVVLIQPLQLPWGSLVELVLITGAGEEELRLPAELRWLEHADQQALAGFRFTRGDLPANRIVARLLQEKSALLNAGPAG